MQKIRLGLSGSKDYGRPVAPFFLIIVTNNFRIVLLDDFSGIVRRTIVHHDFQGAIALRQHGIDSLLEKFVPVMGRNHHSNKRNRHNSSFQ